MRLQYTCTSDAFKGQVIEATVITCSPCEKRNINNIGIVYCVSEFRIPGDDPKHGGWKLMPREYRTLAGLIAAAKRDKITVVA